MELINNLAENYPKNKEPLIYNVVLEGGAFNGIYSGGALILVKQLEKHFQAQRVLATRD